MVKLKTKDIIAKIDEFFESEFLPEEKSDWKRAMKKTATFDNISPRKSKINRLGSLARF